MLEILKKTENISNFFKEYGGQLFNTDGGKGRSVDASGILSSVNNESGKAICQFIKKYLPHREEKINILDVGCGVGYLQKAFDEDPCFNGYSFEGALELLPKMICNLNRISICKLEEKLKDIRLKKAFHITTSFEVIEHVHRKDQSMFWRNLKFLSEYHLCSIHVANGEYPKHCTIWKPIIWEKFFRKQKINFIKLGNFPISRDEKKEIFRKETGLYNWDCSVIYLLNFCKDKHLFWT